MLASLNHPYIATIHGLEQSNGTSYLVMELVSCETLQERIRREGPVPVEEALSIAKVKVLAFGLAKAFAEDTETSDPINSPTLSMAAGPEHERTRLHPRVADSQCTYRKPHSGRNPQMEKLRFSPS